MSSLNIPSNCITPPSQTCPTTPYQQPGQQVYPCAPTAPYQQPMQQVYPYAFTAPYWSIQSTPVNRPDQGVMAYQEKACIDVAKKAVISDIDINTSKRKAEIQADIAERKKLQHTTLQIGSNGTVTIQQDQFGSPIKNRLPITFHFAEQLKVIGIPGDITILHISLANTKQQVRSLFFHLDHLENRFICKQFDRAGISFGFGTKKEREVQKELILLLRDQAEIVYIPAKHGWYQHEGTWHYAFPEDNTWKEIQQWIL